MSLQVAQEHAPVKHTAVAAIRKPPRGGIKLTRFFLRILNLVSTVLTLYSGLTENSVVTSFTGTYDSIRMRLVDGSINFENARFDTMRVEGLTPLADISKSFRFIKAPRRDPSTVGENRTTCTRVNSINTTIMGLMYDDFWGKGPRRIQQFVFSISAPNCKVINLAPKWYAACISSHGGNATACHEHILQDFDGLLADRRNQVAAEHDFGTKGVPFLKCFRRSLRTFEYQTDLVTFQAYWAGGSYHIQVQTSNCLALPRVRTTDDKWSLFQAEGVDEGSDVLLAVPDPGWFSLVVSSLYSVVSATIIATGIAAAVIRSRWVRYLPNEVRYTGKSWILRYLLPFMPIATEITETPSAVISFHGGLLVASDLWINHWLYMTLSILNTVTNIRLTYVTFQVGTWMLIMKITFGSFIFLSASLNEITWLMCLMHTILRIVLKLLVRFLVAVKLVRKSRKEVLGELIDGSCMFINYKLYKVILLAILGLMLRFIGQPTFMRRQTPYKVGMQGGIPRISSFWRSEMVCDLASLIGIQAACGLVIGFTLMATRYRRITQNGVMKLIQRRYFLVGWDGFMVADMLGLDPGDPELIYNGSPRTKCTFGALLQLLYQSGPSSFVHLAGDYLFAGRGIGTACRSFMFPVKKAIAMGICRGDPVSDFSGSTDKMRRGPGFSSLNVSRLGMKESVSSNNLDDEPDIAPKGTDKSIFDRNLVIVNESYLGKILLIDEDKPGYFAKSEETGLREFAVYDVLGFISKMDIKAFVTGSRTLRIS